ncbi:hypothetical protein Srufu_064770 [Streptomyces libani subsp. rufus]|nr:hypothetical protein Srufu_064770 [Streptomyces libani subsp. rufus]
MERVAESDYRGVLAPVAQVLSSERVLTPELLALCRSVADRYAGTLADVVQLAVPPRRARAEAKPSPAPLPPNPPPEPGSWERYGAGAGFLAALTRGTRRGRCGRRCPGRPGRRSWRGRRPRRWRAAAVRWWWCRTGGPRRGWTPRSVS